MKKNTVTIILAGGTGERMNEATPKQFLKLAGKPILMHALGQFEKSASVSSIVVICHKNYVKDVGKLIKRNKIKKVYKVAAGGKTRQESSFIGVKNCPPDTEIVLIHDAVRPFVDEKIIKDTLSAAEESGASGTVIDTADTIIVKKGDFIGEIPDRNKLKRIQTPQGFCYETILKAHEWAVENGIKDSTDDCGLVLAMGAAVKWVEGSARNIKITDQADLFLAEKFIKSEEEGNVSG